MSSWLARELKRRLRDRAAVLREVEINLRLAETDGDIPGLLAVAHTTGAQALSVPGEVKCSWHRQVVTAVRDQFGLRYLQGPHGTTGVYVIVHFGGSAWDTGDSRRAQSARLSLDGLRQDLRQEATDLAERGVTHPCLRSGCLARSRCSVGVRPWDERATFTWSPSLTCRPSAPASSHILLAGACAYAKTRAKENLSLRPAARSGSRSVVGGIPQSESLLGLLDT
ncbi:hypothetical protein [Streptomyces sp. NPDC020965]|uniref:hypothetical protein n=1 Tax=Streptomyces sp. NPDC020965 TaxID=3365105 RepID=UPI0037A973D6